MVPVKVFPCPTSTPLLYQRKKGSGVPVAEAVRVNCEPRWYSASEG